MKTIRIQWLSLLAVSSLYFAANAAAAAPASVQILSAVVKDQTIAGAEVLLQKNGEQTLRGVTSADGRFTVGGGAVSPDDGLATLIVKKDGYSTLVAKCPCANLTYAISPVMRQLDGLRIVLNWGNTPPDEDSHLVFPDGHVWYQHKSDPDVALDVDDTDGYGPETITVDRKHFGERYVYAVHDYTNGSRPGTDQLGNSSASVRVYVGQTLVRSYYAKPGKRGNTWVVFGITSAGDFEDIDSYQDLTDGNLEAALKSLVGTSSNFTGGVAAIADASAQSQAQALNKQGEDAYHQQDYDSAITLFRQAIDLSPNYGQAYSNLGLTFQKANRESEAIWANRKAIALAAGADAPRVRASSYFNIARIYEARSQWADAGQQYELAERERHNDIYVKAIARVKAKQS